jgi:PKD repeat protein
VNEVARVRRDSATGTEGIGTSYGYRPPTVENNEMVGYCGSGMKTAPRPRRSLGLGKHAKIGMLVAFVATIAALSAMTIAPSVMKADVSGTLPPVAAFVAYPNKLNVTVDATDSIDPDGTIVSYDWNFGDGSVASGMNVSHVYATWGTWWITLTVTDNDAMTGTTSTQVTVTSPSDPPPPPFTLFGYIYDSGGNLAFLASVTVTDLNTGAVWYAMTDDTYGYYLVYLINETGFTVGDTVLVEATLGTDSGFATGVTAEAWIEVDVTMVVIPEFSMVVLPVIGVVAIAAVVSLSRRRDEK